jgi:hypothetical protein
MPQLGIFWAFNGEVIGRARPLAEGCERWPGLLDSPDDHMTLWDDPTLKKAHLHLAPSDYTEVPRGRVIFSTKENRAIIYLDEALSSTAVRKRIRAFFDLQSTPVTWKGDPHYTTDPQKLDAIFEEEFPSD